MPVFTRILLLTLALAIVVTLTRGHATAQVRQLDSARIPSFDLTPNGDAWAYFLDLGPVYTILVGRNIDVSVGVKGAPDTGTVTLIINGEAYPATYVGPTPGFNPFDLVQINAVINPNVLVKPASLYLRVCDSEGNCKNSIGATLRREQ